jgi:mannosyl-3-phosphoglycerate phosphatase
MKNPPKLVVFSDLDGTLLDHETYLWKPAESALRRLAALRVPVVLTSSKTACEMKVLQDDMGLGDWPAIVENGAGVIGLSDVHPPEIYSDLRKALDRLPARLRQSFQGFGDLTVEEISTLTGLPNADAQRAKARRYSEPGLWSGTDKTLAEFTSALARESLMAQQGGRFLTVSFGRTKADAMDTVIKTLRAEITLALGDAPNDFAMLEKADLGVIVANPHRAVPPLLSGEKDGRIMRTQALGPAGWNHAVHGILDELGFAEGRTLNG